ncbi:DNA-damage inducible protein P [Legionella wadsworthii]|uniref:DNA polymerase IV n=2 Tax=Legionella wadsworthii TaxID=28088 RepID=A0A378LVK9_9GAMM|nr:DNA-damage inducible protein P [Legionella wadsworthii]
MFYPTSMHSNRKIIHIDMDCFYAAIEIRDNPSLNNKPVAVGGLANQRGVLCTCNYAAREYGIHSAMPTAIAQRLCPDLVVLPVNMPKYKAVSQLIQNIFKQYTELVEPLSLDEAFLDVTHALHCRGSATLMAQAIRERIYRDHQLTASAGVAPNKFLAKIASAWNKPNGLFVITPEEVAHFIKKLPVSKLFGVGKVTTSKLNQMHIFTCSDLYRYPLDFLIKNFGKFGKQLYEQAHGIDNRPVQPYRQRKSLSVEKTLQTDIHDPNEVIRIINELYKSLIIRLNESAADLKIKNQFIKIKMNNFKLVSAEVKSKQINLEQYIQLFEKMSRNPLKPIRLIGLGVHFSSLEDKNFYQPPLFEIEG